ncbi:uncharacterized protein LOC144557475 [Carex rostrata]
MNSERGLDVPHPFIPPLPIFCLRQTSLFLSAFSLLRPPHVFSRYLSSNPSPDLYSFARSSDLSSSLSLSFLLQLRRRKEKPNRTLKAISWICYIGFHSIIALAATASYVHRLSHLSLYLLMGKRTQRSRLELRGGHKSLSKEDLMYCLYL